MNTCLVGYNYKNNSRKDNYSDKVLFIFPDNEVCHKKVKWNPDVSVTYPPKEIIKKRTMASVKC